MNIRSITMGEALETLAQQSLIVPSILFRRSESVNNEMGEESFRESVELVELP